MIEYSLALIMGFVIAKAVTPYSPKLQTKKLTLKQINQINSTINDLQSYIKLNCTKSYIEYSLTDLLNIFTSFKALLLIKTF